MGVSNREEAVRTALPHQVILQDRRALSVSGVSDVDSFDGATVVVYTEMGELTVRGNGLQIQRLNVETGDLSLSGEIDSLTYADAASRRGGKLGRLFR